MKLQMSLVTRKPVFRVCDQIRLKPACSVTATSLGLEMPGCAGWCAPLLFVYGKNRFSHDMAQIITYDIYFALVYDTSCQHSSYIHGRQLCPLVIWWVIPVITYKLKLCFWTIFWFMCLICYYTVLSTYYEGHQLTYPHSSWAVFLLKQLTSTKYPYYCQ